MPRTLSQSITATGRRVLRGVRIGRTWVKGVDLIRAEKGAPAGHTSGRVESALNLGELLPNRLRRIFPSIGRRYSALRKASPVGEAKSN